MSLALVFLGWFFMFFYGVVLLRTSKKRKTGMTLITLFFAPITLLLMFSLLSWIFFDLSLIDINRIGCGLNANHYSECYPEGYFPS